MTSKTDLVLHASKLKAGDHLRLLQADSEPMELLAAEEGKDNKQPTFKMVAYNGGAMSVGYGMPVVVDLSGLKVSTKSRPILRDHDPGKIVGHTTAIDVASNRITVAGVISAGNEHSREVVESAKGGFPWQASIGATVQKLAFIDKGETVEVNGKKFTGPLYVARQATLGEVSFVALGADDSTSARVAAEQQKEADMGFEAWLKAKGFDAEKLDEKTRASLQAMYDAEQKAIQAAADPEDDPEDEGDDGNGVQAQLKAMRETAAKEAERIAAINKHAGDHPEIVAKAIREGWDETKVELEVLRAERPKAPAGHVVDDRLSDQVLEAAMLLACKSDGEKLVKSYGEKTVEAAEKRFRNRIGLQQVLLAMAAIATGKRFETIRGHERDVLKAAFSTTSLPSILSNTANKLLLEGFLAVEQAWRRIAQIVPVSDFKTHTWHRMSGDMIYEEVSKEGQLKHGGLGEETYTNRAKTFGKIFSLTREDIRNDDMGAFNDIRRRLGRGGALALNKAFWTEFLNNSAFFAAGKKNYFSGGTSVLQSSSLQTAEQMLMDQVDADGHPLALSGAILLVPTSLSVDAQELYVSTNLNTGGGSSEDKVPNRNVFAGKYQPVASTYLSNASFTGNSSTAWYLLANPADMATIQVCFLDGNETPIVESADADFDQLGIQFRGYHDFGVAKTEYRAGVKSKGAA